MQICTQDDTFTFIGAEKTPDKKDRFDHGSVDIPKNNLEYSLASGISGYQKTPSGKNEEITIL